MRIVVSAVFGTVFPTTDPIAVVSDGAVCIVMTPEVAFIAGALDNCT